MVMSEERQNFMTRLLIERYEELKSQVPRDGNSSLLDTNTPEFRILEAFEKHSEKIQYQEDQLHQRAMRAYFDAIESAINDAEHGMDGTRADPIDGLLEPK